MGNLDQSPLVQSFIVLQSREESCTPFISYMLGIALVWGSEWCRVSSIHSSTDTDSEDKSMLPRVRALR